jgi:hypothetical protein
MLNNRRNIEDANIKKTVTYRRVIAAVIGLIVIFYVILVITGYIETQNRLEISEVGIIILLGIAIVVIVNPTLVERLSFVKLPGGIEMTLHEIVRTQEKQQSELNDVRFMLTYLLSVAEPSTRTCKLCCWEMQMIIWYIDLCVMSLESLNNSGCSRNCRGAVQMKYRMESGSILSDILG